MGVGITLAGVIVIIGVTYKLYKKRIKNNQLLLDNENENENENGNENKIISFINTIETAV
jgi:hypothetical protein